MSNNMDTSGADDGYSAWRSPYVKDNVISLVFKGQIVKATIVDVSHLEMFYLTVKLQIPNAKERTCRLRMWDRRFDLSRREFFDLRPWDPKLEHIYNLYVRSGEAKKLFIEWTRTGVVDEMNSEVHLEIGWGLKDDEKIERWADEKEEAYQQWEKIMRFRREFKAYNLLKDMQGTRVPKVLGTVKLLLPSSGLDDSIDEFLDIPGMVFEHIEGFCFWDLEGNLPYDQWEPAVKAALEILDMYHARGIVNKSTMMLNFVVQKDTGKIFMTEFGNVIFRDEMHLDNFDTASAKLKEEDSIGYGVHFLQKGIYMHEVRDATFRNDVYWTGEGSEVVASNRQKESGSRTYFRKIVPDRMIEYAML